jgi:hypothetical protein
MESFIWFAIDVFIGILLALMEQARANTEPGYIECDKDVVYGAEEDDDEDNEE